MDQRTVSVAVSVACVGVTAVCLHQVLRLRRLVLQERQGRTKAEIALRQGIQKAEAQEGFQVIPVGFVNSSYPQRVGAPRQGILVPTSKATLVLGPHIPPASLDGLQQYSHVWIVYVFHENTNAMVQKDKRTFPAKVKPPQLGGAKVGLFATRTPHRPNPIGLTVVRLDKVDMATRTLHLSGVDMVHGTPVLDIKPYIARYDSIADATAASWTGEGVVPLSVVFTDEAKAAITRLVPKAKHYSSADALMTAIEETLRLDIRSVHQGRGKPGGSYRFPFDALLIEFMTSDARVTVTDASLHKLAVDAASGFLASSFDAASSNSGGGEGTVAAAAAATVAAVGGDVNEEEE